MILNIHYPLKIYIRRIIDELGWNSCQIELLKKQSKGGINTYTA